MGAVQNSFAKRGGGFTVLPPSAIDALATNLRGSLLSSAHAEYETARRVWNGMVNTKPGLIVRCAGASDVIEAVKFAREHALVLAVRGGGHNIAGSGSCEGGLVIDLSQQKSVVVDPARRSAHVGPGATLSDFDHEAQAFGLATPTGINSTTGVAGLALGGGFGWLSRRFGLTCDNLLSADVVLADGRFVRASETDNPDLFWALRGGGGNFGVVTRFEFGLHPVGPEVTAGLVVFPYEQALDVLMQYRELTERLGDESSLWAVLRHAPPLPFLPAEVHGRKVIVMAMMSIGTNGEPEAMLESVRKFGNAVGEHVGKMPFVLWQKAFDPLLTAGARNYWKSHNFASLGNGAIDVVNQYAGTLPSPHCEIFIGQLGGAVNRISRTATAYAHRDVEFVLNVHARWETPEEDATCIGWARGFFDAATPHATGGVYVNFMTAEEQGRIQLAYGDNYERLASLKTKYDPQNMFCTNQNIRPAPSGPPAVKRSGNGAGVVPTRHR